jgi:hypothetical protein
MRDSTFTAKAPRTPRNAKEIRLVAASLLQVNRWNPWLKKDSHRFHEKITAGWMSSNSDSIF